ncbi:hypothetical protein V1525DRAFT_411847 [Lipomyces kononenkoae]|uniref:Uncharacterized protein n=1 Tax=Lipomyces kononenkoae TaxID=34357 RepID=A0ACC3SU47_LIPKO
MYISTDIDTSDNTIPGSHRFLSVSYQYPTTTGLAGMCVFHINPVADAKGCVRALVLAACSLCIAGVHFRFCVFLLCALVMLVRCCSSDL